MVTAGLPYISESRKHERAKIRIFEGNVSHTEGQHNVQCVQLAWHCRQQCGIQLPQQTVLFKTATNTSGVTDLYIRHILPEG